MFRLDYKEYEVGQISIIENLLPPGSLNLNSELKRIDNILKRNNFESFFIEKAAYDSGRYITPIRPYIRIMILKRYYRMSYSSIRKYIMQNLMLKNFCRIPYEKAVPATSTIANNTRKYTNKLVNNLFADLDKKFGRKCVYKKRKSTTVSYIQSK